MAKTVQDILSPGLPGGSTDNVVCTPAQEPASLGLRTVWQQTQGSWRDHPVWQGRTLREVMVWLRGEDRDG